jgi:hypothetical protein
LLIAKEEREARSLPQADIDMPSNEINFDVPNETLPLPEGDVADSQTLSRKRPAAKSKTSKRRRIEKSPSPVASSSQENSSSSDDEDEEDQPPVNTVIIGGKMIRQLPFQAVPRKMQGQRPRPRPLLRSRQQSNPDNNMSTDLPSADASTTDTRPSDDAMVIDTPSMSPTALGSREISVDRDDETAIDTSTTSPDSPVGHKAVVGHDTSSVVLDDSAWPVWFRNGYGVLKEANLGEKWEELLVKYVAIETRAKFVNPKGAMHALSSDKRPTEVEWWIGRARKLQPAIKNIPKFETSFWAWWKALQPRWREVRDVPGVLTHAHRQGDGDWSELDKPGQNGFLTVISLLSWWGQALRGGSLGMVEWQAAADDVNWVLTQMLNVTDRG